MRLIGSLPNEQIAQRFADHLLTLGVNIMVEEGDTGWTVWVESDDHLDQARQALDEFARQPDDPQYRSTASTAARLRAREEDQAQQRRRNFIDVRTSWARPATGHRSATFVRIALCCVVAAASLSVQRNERAQEKFDDVINPLRITEIRHGWFTLGLPEIRHGQARRLLTPIFIHFDIWHLLFNMIWLYQLGSLIEARKGSWFLVALVVVSAIPSNLLQYLWPIDNISELFQFWRLQPNANSGGMSGVVYALFGYAWLKGRLQPYEGMVLHQNAVFIMLAWLVLCFTGLMGPIGNTAHAMGLIMGMIFGAAPYWWRRMFR